MEENNNENGFVLQNDLNTDEGNPQPDPTQYQQTQTNQSQNQQAQYGQSDSEPQPMPYSDNTYRFQNAAPQQERKKENKKTNFSPVKFIAGGLIFGVVAAFCFFGINAVLGHFIGSNSTSVGQVETNPLSPVVTASGSAAAPSDVSSIVERVMPSIVSITEKSTKTSYFGQTYSSQGAGSGFIVKQDNKQLLIVTNNHVVEGADKISVQFHDGETVDATVKGTNDTSDLAVLIVKLSDLKQSTKEHIKVATLGSSDDAKVGQMVIAIGNALGYGQSVTVGYVSAKDREVVTQDETTGKSTTHVLLQTDAAINPGNSGGALIDTNGNVIGINESKYFSYNNTNVEGMGYAIPMSDAVSVINSLMNREVLEESEKGYLGITGRNISSSVSKSYGIPEGVYVAAVSDTGAASKAGMKQGDVITKINDETVKTIEEVQEIVNNTKAGTKINVIIKRTENGEYKEKTIQVTLKNKSTLDGLEDDSTDNNTQSQNDSNNGNGQDNSDGSEVVPWGSIY